MEARVLKKMTQNELAEKVGISRAYYTNIELGNKNPSFAVAVRIKSALNTRDDRIFFDQKGVEREQ
jgi:putative transcriptional regulator